MNVSSRFTCPRCGNSDRNSIGVGPDGKEYCRRCLVFSGKQAEPYVSSGKDIPLKLGYPLTAEQQRVSDQVLELIKQNRPALIRAVTGAGKTELVYASMAYVLSLHQPVAFSTPRRDVAIELEPRIREAFPDADIALVYGGHEEKLVGDIVVLTAHQLYRYPKYFGLVILDEIDAFPYAGDFVLKSFFRGSVKGTYIMLSATPSEKDIKELEKDRGEVIELNVRYHQHPLPLPEIRKYGLLKDFAVLRCLKSFLNSGKPCFVFAPTIDRARGLADFLRVFLPDGDSVDSKDPERERKIEDFKAGKLSYLVCTAVLERGVTVRDLQVIVVDADSEIYDAPALIQIAGRAGRKAGYDRGEVVFFVHTPSPWVKEAVETIVRINENARVQGLFQNS